MNDDWYTPEPVLAAVRSWLGPIDLDPCSSAAANERVRAGRFYTIDDNALVRPWNATTVYMNPPYSRGNIDRFVDKFLSEYRAGAFYRAAVLTNATTDTRAGQALLANADYAFFPRGRISFRTPDDRAPGKPPCGQMITLFGIGAPPSAHPELPGLFLRR